MSTLSPIKTLEQLKRVIHTGTGYDGIATMLNHIEFGADEVADLCKWDSDSYQKVVIESGEDYELTLICWEKGQETKVHDHNSAQSWICVLEGELTEHLYYNSDPGSPLLLRFKETINPKSASYTNDELGVHKITNTNEGRTISLHYYTKPQKEINVFDEKSGDVTSKRMLP